MHAGWEQGPDRGREGRGVNLEACVVCLVKSDVQQRPVTRLLDVSERPLLVPLEYAPHRALQLPAQALQLGCGEPCHRWQQAIYGRLELPAGILKSGASSGLTAVAGPFPGSCGWTGAFCYRKNSHSDIRRGGLPSLPGRTCDWKPLSRRPPPGKKSSVIAVWDVGHCRHGVFSPRSCPLMTSSSPLPSWPRAAVRLHHG
jgi:hypothetical protein